LETVFCNRVKLCKQRDDIRGKETIPSYEETHVLVDHDLVVLSISNMLEQRKRNVDQMLEKLSNLL
jgi:hypothetical protein